MQTDTLSLLISFLPPVVLILGVVLVYLRGKSINNRIMNRVVNEFEAADDFIESLSLISDSTTGRTYTTKLAKPKGSEDELNNIQRLRIHFSMEERHMLFSWIFLIFKKAKDFVIIEGDPSPQKNEYMNIELVRSGDLGKYQLEKLNEEFTEHFHDFEPNSEFSLKFIHKTNHPQALKYLYQSDPLIKKLIFNISGLHRISIKRKEDYTFRLVIKISKDFDMKLVKHLATRILKALSVTNQTIIKKPKRFLAN